MRASAAPVSIKRRATLVIALVLAVFAGGYVLSMPVWQCETLAPASGVAVINRDCRHVPRSRALWTWFSQKAHL